MKRIGNISFGTQQAYDKFVSLSKKEQVEKVYNSLSPKDMAQAEKLLSRVPNGDSETNSRQPEKGSNTTEATGKGSRGNRAGQGANTEAGEN